MLPPQLGDRATRSEKVFQRAYMACLTCRKTKSKCEASDDVNTCLKCKREKRQCIFTGRRSAKQRSKIHSVCRPILSGNERSKSLNNEYWNSASSSSNCTTTTSSSFIRAAGSEYPPSDTRQSPLEKGSPRARPPLSSPGKTRSTKVSLHHRIETSLQSSSNPLQPDLGAELMQTVVSSTQDAISLLFKAAAHQDGDPALLADSQVNHLELGSTRSNENETPSSSGIPFISNPQEELDLWKQSRFVRQNWMSPREAIAYIDLFFANMSHLSLVTNIHFSRHENHRSLVFDEPLLCATLLMISSRYHALDGARGTSRSHYVHDCLWRHIRSLIHGLTFGEEVLCSSRLRTSGSVEALLLLTEWHPRILAFPQYSDSSASCEASPLDDCGTRQPPAPADSTGTRWREEVFEPAKRADRLSWMMLGLASSLAHELRVYEEYEVKFLEKDKLAARQRLRRLLYLNVNQLALALGCTSTLPLTVSNITMDSLAVANEYEDAFCEGEKLISLWIDLMGLLKIAKGLSFSGRSEVREGAYNDLLDQLQPLLNQWFRQFQSFKRVKASAAAVDLLFVEYQYVRMYVGSIEVQCLIESVGSNKSRSKRTVFEVLRFGNCSDLASTKDVLDASMSILSKSVSWARSGILRFCPNRVFFRIMSACVFLLKALGLGIQGREVTGSLDLLDLCTAALTTLATDDAAQPWGKYAVLIQRYSAQFRCRIAPAEAGSCVPSTDSTTHDGGRSVHPREEVHIATGGVGEYSQGDLLSSFDPVDDATLDDWLMEPWDMSICSSDFSSQGPSTATF